MDSAVQMKTILNSTDGFYITQSVPDWVDLIRSSDFHLCPRGFGVTSYRMYECLQAETIPIYIWSQVCSSGGVPGFWDQASNFCGLKLTAFTD